MCDDVCRTINIPSVNSVIPGRDFSYWIFCDFSAEIPAVLPWSTRLNIAVGAAKGLAFLHDAEKPVIYRDFKASNILLDSVSSFLQLAHVILIDYFGVDGDDVRHTLSDQYLAVTIIRTFQCKLAVNIGSDFRDFSDSGIVFQSIVG